jgi:hypothetical protein
MSLRSLALLLLFALPFAGCSCGSHDHACQKDTDCKAGQKCVPTKVSDSGAMGPNVCITGAECGSDSDCTAMDQRKECDNTTHKCIFRPGFANDCDETRPCPFGQFCSTLIGKCFVSSMSRDCTRRAQCPQGQMCDTVADKCVPDLGCYGDNFCEQGERCDLTNHLCVQNAVDCTSCMGGPCPNASQTCADDKECLAAGQMPACHTGEKCNPLGRCVQCLSNDQCGMGLFCNLSTGQCESNVQCAPDPSQCPTSMDVHCVMCTPPQVCDPITKKCSAPATTCSSNIDCPGDQFCNLMLMPPICQPRIPDCPSDRYDAMGAASPATAPVLDPAQATTTMGTQAIYDDLELCPAEVDWYKLVVAGGTYLSIDARFVDAVGDIDLELYLADAATLIGASHSQRDYERIELDAGVDVTLLLRVYHAIPTINPIPYKLIITRDPGDICMEDMYEPNDSPSQATTIVSDVPIEARICPANPDWFVIHNVPTKTRIDAQLSFTASLGQLDLELYGADAAAPILISNTTNQDLQEIVYDASTTSTASYYLRVIGRGADQNVYTLRVSLRSDPTARCTDDRYEPNNVPGMATDAISFITADEPNLSICSGDEDWYSLQLGPGEAITAEIGFQPSADLDLGIFPGDTTDPHVVPLRESTGTSIREFAGYRTMSAGTFLVRVFGHTPADISVYDMRIRRQPPLVCRPDRITAMGKGTSMANAYDPMMVPPMRLDDLTLCLGDPDDWYKLTLKGGFQNVIRIQYLESDAILDMALLDMNGMMLGSTGGFGTDYKEIGVNFPGAGLQPFFLHVFKSQGNETAYNLTVDLIPIFSCFPDVAEPDDDITHASHVASSTISPVDVHFMTLCASQVNPMTGWGDQDYYLLHPPHAGSRINASITYMQGDLFLELLAPGGAVRACVNAGSDKCYSDDDMLAQSISFTATTAQPYYLRVSSIYASPTVVVKPPNIDTAYDLHITYGN